MEKSITFRSKFEEEVYKELVKKVHVEYESEGVNYYEYKYYIPDFRCKNTIWGTPYFIEAKGYFRPEDRRKLIAVRDSNPTIDLRLLFQRDNKLNKRGKMTYTQWAEKHGFECAVGEVPKEWLE